MKKFLLVLCLCLFPFTLYAEEINIEKVGSLSAHMEPSFLDAYVYKICVDNYEYVAMKRTTGTGGMAITQSYERVTDKEGKVVALPKMCSIKEH